MKLIHTLIALTTLICSQSFAAERKPLKVFILAGHADAIVTNNTRDLGGGEMIFPDLRILTPAEFLKTLRP